jgi:23S rRNA pseudouridine1911/1915/1917 synthase
VADSPLVQNFTVPAGSAGSRLDQWLTSKLPDVSRVRVQQLIEQKKILVNGKLPKPSMKLSGGEEIIIAGQVELTPLRAFPQDIPLDVIYEDESIAVINKPAGMSVHAGSGKGEAGNRGTMVNALLHRFNGLSQIGGEMRPGIVHRLDKETSGLVIVAKSDLAHRKLAEQFARREVKKTYTALVHGGMKTAKGTINAAISRDQVRRTRMTTRVGRGKPGRDAITHWQVIKEIDSAYGKFSLLEVRIETGRTHQIRVHLSSAGHPIVGDTLYGAPGKVLSYGGTGSEPASLERNFLHASAIQFQHPISNRPLAFQQPLPDELREFLRQIGD